MIPSSVACVHSYSAGRPPHHSHQHAPYGTSAVAAFLMLETLGFCDSLCASIHVGVTPCCSRVSFRSRGHLREARARGRRKWQVTTAQTVSTADDPAAPAVPAAAAEQFVSKASLKGRLPYDFPLNLGGNRVLRELQDTDIETVMQLAFEEFMPEDIVDRDDGWNPLSALVNAWERLSLRCTIWLGFKMRIKIAQGGLDHKVFCVSEALPTYLGLESTEPDAAGPPGGGLAPQLVLPAMPPGAPPALPPPVEGRCIGLAETSLQPVHGGTAPPLPVPLGWKKAWAAGRQPLAPYISNILVDPRRRRGGVATSLMRVCEDQARAWGFKHVYLHVELGYTPAMKLYYELGYTTVSEDPMWYTLLEMPRLRYLRKEL